MLEAKIWSDMFHLGLPLAEKILRPVIVYVFLVAALRLAGKRELAQLNPFDLVVLLTLSNTVQNAIIGEDNSVVGGLIGAATLLAINYLVVRVLFSHRKLDKIVEGGAEVLIAGGKVLRKRLKEELITFSQLEAAAHKQGFASLDEIERAVLEPGGNLSFIAKKPEPGVARYSDITARLDGIATDLRLLRARLGAS
jgi:uncharacterized membrane protein YcaP (DUF421 family)